ncbi:putative Sel1-like repeat-containing protein C1B3.10c [Ceratocystis fimbriata CBS 114723]|uniref:Putative Sel1-like repeat-containing protein C1B3.10c n=1 Tax=Ceratocystis fimbriata CBS 114723 TaxID=1035309 RepID=A0A2C5X2W2_9PEZI|nr:putative Sel1-like repeat-containing protein C1B3.10c [Ceratocystis fimbriata CBS 114723]
MRSTPLWLVLLAQALGTVVASTDGHQAVLNDNSQDSGHQNAAQHAAAGATDNVPALDIIKGDRRQKSAPASQPGAEYVDQARTIFSALEKNPPTPNHWRSRGFFADLILGALPSFSLSAPQDRSSSQHTQSIPPDLVKAVDLLERAAAESNTDAFHMLGDLYFYGNFTWPRNFDKAYAHYKNLAGLGDASGHFMVGLFYSSGISQQVPQDQAKAHLYYTAAAKLGHTRAQMAIGFRHHMGIATPKSCEKAGTYYRSVARKAIDWVNSGPPGGQHWVVEAYHISEEDGGIYGFGASATSSGANAVKVNPNSDANAAIDDVIEYLDLMSKKSDSKASLNLGRIYYEGQRGLERNFDLAKKYFLMVAHQYWKRDGTVIENPPSGLDRLAGKAATYLGRIYLRGEGVDPNFTKARYWIQRGIANGEPQAYYLQGLMYKHGLGVTQDSAIASDRFKYSAERLDYNPSQVEMGKIYLERGSEADVKSALHFFEHAALHNNLEAYYYLGELTYQGIGRDRACNLATHYFKRVAERVEPLTSGWSIANDAFEIGDIDTALVHYLVMAEQGWDAAQINMAYIIDSAKSWLKLPLATSPLPAPSPTFQNHNLAMVYWTRSSMQGNVDATVKVGDYYYYGIGHEKDMVQAGNWYSLAAEHSASAQALWNLGYMHENGMGLKQDFHLAKRYYDMALEVSPEAFLPVTVSLLRLRMRSAWNTMTHGPIHSIEDEPKTSQHKSIREWIKAFMADQPRYYEQYSENMFEETYHEEVAHEVYEESILDTMLLVSIIMLISALIYYRHQRQLDAQRRREANAQGQGQGQHPLNPNQQHAELAPGAGHNPANNPPFAAGFMQPGGQFQNWGAGGVGQ